MVYKRFSSLIQTRNHWRKLTVTKKEKPISQKKLAKREAKAQRKADRDARRAQRKAEREAELARRQQIRCQRVQEREAQIEAAKVYCMGCNEEFTGKVHAVHPTKN